MLAFLITWIAQTLNAERYNDDVLRARFTFDSPNDFAAAVVIVFAGLLVLGDHCTAGARRRRTLDHVLFAVLLAATAFTTFLLAAAYSRAGYVAAAAAGAILLGVTRRLRWPLLAWLLILTSALLAPATGKRINGDLHHDASVTNRLLLWGDAARMSLHGPAWGWRKAGFERAYWPWFQDLRNNARYPHAVSNFFTVSVYYGPAGALVYSAGVVAFLVVGATLAMNCVFARIGLLAQSAFHICGLFSFIHAELVLNVMLLISLAFTLGALGIFFRKRSKVSRAVLRRFAFGIGALGTVPLALLAIVAFWTSRGAHGSFSHLVLTKNDSGVVEIEQVTLVPENPFARLYWLHGKGDSEAYDRYLLKELTRRDVLVTWISAGALSTDGVTALGPRLQALLAESSHAELPVYLGGSGSGAQLALLVAEKNECWPMRLDGLWIMERLTRALPPQLALASSSTLPPIHDSKLKLGRPARMSQPSSSARQRESQRATSIASSLAAEFAGFATSKLAPPK